MEIYEGINQEYKKKILEKYDKRFNIVSKTVTGFNDEKAYKLGVMLENTEQAFNRTGIFESTQSPAMADLKNMYFDIVTASFPMLISEDLFSIQPLTQKVGQIFFMNYLYGSNKGRVKKGDTVFGPNKIAGYENRNYTGETVEDEVIFSQESGGTETDFKGNISYIPVIPGTINVVFGGNNISDDGKGNLTGTGVTGVIDYENGKFEIAFSTAPAPDDAYCSYNFDMSYAPSTIPEIDLRVSSSMIQARPRKLRGLYSLDAGYDLKQSQGIDIQEELLSAASTQLRHETDGELIIDAMKQASNTQIFDAQYNSTTTGISKREFYQEFIGAIIEASSMIEKATKRVKGNWIVVGKFGSDILEYIGKPRYVSNGGTNNVGPHFAGTLDGKWKVYVNPFLNDDEFLVGYKGATLLDAGLVYGPYLPFFATETIMLDDFVGRRGFASSYGKKMVNADFYVKGKIINM